jgi:hypothetical protein
MIKVYIAGKLNAGAVDYIHNVHAMITAANRIRLMGHSVYPPCQDIVTGLIIGDLTYNDFFENNLPWLKCADCLYIMPNSEESSGTQAEIKLARLYDIPVIFDIEELRNK